MASLSRTRTLAFRRASKTCAARPHRRRAALPLLDALVSALRRYATGVDMHTHGQAILKRHKIFLSVGHDVSGLLTYRRAHLTCRSMCRVPLVRGSHSPPCRRPSCHHPLEPCHHPFVTTPLSSPPRHHPLVTNPLSPTPFDQPRGSRSTGQGHSVPLSRRRVIKGCTSPS